MASKYCHNVPISELSKDMRMNIRITGVRMFTWRMTIATWLIRLAAIVMPFKATINVAGGDE